MDSESVAAQKSPPDSPRELRQIFFKAGVPMTPKEYLWPDPMASAAETPGKPPEGPPEAPRVAPHGDSSNRPASESSAKIKDPWRSSEHHPAVDSAESSAKIKDSIAAPESVASAAGGKATDPTGDSPDARTQEDKRSEGEGGVLSSKAPTSSKRRYGSGLMLPRSLFRRRGRDSHSGKEREFEIESGKTVEEPQTGREVASREGRGVVGGATGEEIRAIDVGKPLTAVDLGLEKRGGRAAAGEKRAEGERISAGERGGKAEVEVQPPSEVVRKEERGLSAESEGSEESEEREEGEEGEKSEAIATKGKIVGREGVKEGGGSGESGREAGEGRGVVRGQEGRAGMAGKAERAEKAEGSAGVMTLRRMKDALRSVLWPQREQLTRIRAPGPPVDAPPSPLSRVPPKRTASLPSDTPMLVPHWLPFHVHPPTYHALFSGAPVGAPLPPPPGHVPPKRTASLPSDTLLLHHELPAVPHESSAERKRPARPRLKLPFFSPPAPAAVSAAPNGGASASTARTPPRLDLSAAPPSPAAEAAEKLRERARRMGLRRQPQFKTKGEQKGGKTERKEQVEGRGRKEREEQVEGVFTAAEREEMRDTQGSIEQATKALKGRSYSLGSPGNRGEMGKSVEPVGVGPVLSGRELKQMEGTQQMVKSASWNLKWDAEEFKEE
ncbi:unnamed protein product [Closterium sp. NIES-65]|nr:unnamed protein product [Closterium sp. NIES-65]